MKKKDIEKKWPDDGMIIPLKHGLFNVRRGGFATASHDYLFLPVNYRPSVDFPAWRKFLNKSLPGKEGKKSQGLLQKFFGYCLLRNCRYEKALFLLGPGENGKSIISNILQELVGKENCAAVSFPSLENQFHRSSLYRKLLNISTEFGARAINNPYFKAIVTGDTINAAFKCRDVFVFQPYCKLVFASNSLPRGWDNAPGFFRRLLVIEFNRQFREGDPDRDPDLMEKLTEELSGIFNWALHGLNRLLTDEGFDPKDENNEITKDDLYDAYGLYCRAKGDLQYSKADFFLRLKKGKNKKRQV